MWWLGVEPSCKKMSNALTSQWALDRRPPPPRPQAGSTRGLIVRRLPLNSCLGQIRLNQIWGDSPSLFLGWYEYDDWEI